LVGSSPKISIGALLAFLVSSFLVMAAFDGLNSKSAASEANKELSLVEPNTSATGLL